MQKTTVFVRTESKCKQCPLRDRRRVWGRGELKNGICLIGEAPGEDEDTSGIPFIGRAGNKLNSGLLKSHINRDASWLTNIICCRPPQNNIKSFEAQEAIECCWSGFLQELKYLKSEDLQIIVALGNTALQHLIPDAPSITRSRGSIYLFNDVPVLPTFHPSYIMRGAHFKKNDTSVDSTLIWYADLRKAKSIAEDGWQEPKESFNIYPNLRDIEDFLNEAKKNKQHLAVDIETSGGIRRDKAEVFVIGLARDEEHALCVPVLELNKRPYWTEEELQKVKELLNDAFQEQKLIFQNALFDVPILNNNGFIVPWSSVEHDTILLFHALYPELPKNLGFIVSLYGQTPYWKEEFSFRTTAISQMDQEQLRVYNCRDCVVLHQVTPKMVEDLKQLGEDTYTAYREEFLALLEPVDQMMETGVGFSKKNLIAYKKMLEEEVKKLEEKLYSLPPLPRKIIQRKKNGEIINQEAAFNLDSHEDLRWFLFRKEPNKFKRIKEIEKKKPGTIIYKQLQGLKLLRDETPFLFNTRSLTLSGARSGNADLNEEGRLSLRIHLQNELERLKNRKRVDEKVISDKAALETLITWLELFDEYKHLAKILSTYFKFSPWSDGRIHAQFLIWGTATGRLSSKSPNMQQLPKRRKGIRKAFIAPKGKVLISADYSNLEVRVLAEIANDDVLREEVNSNVHDSNTRTLFNINKDHPLWPVARDAAKVFMFGGISYGGGPREIYKKVLIKAPGMQLTFKRFKEALQRWFDAHPGYAQWSQEIKENISERRMTKIFNGRVRQLFGSERDIYKEALNCVDYQTQMLTDKGWKYVTEYEQGDLILAKDIETGELKWEIPLDIKQWPKSTTSCVRYQHPHLDALSTHDHRWMVYSKAQKKDTCKTTDEIGIHGDYRIHRTGLYCGQEPAIYTDDFISLCGWVLTDGYLREGTEKNTCFRISQSQRANPENVEEIDRLFHQLDIPHRRSIQQPQNCVYWDGKGEIGKTIRWLFPERILTMDFIMMLTREQIELLFQTMLRGDGSEEKTGQHQRFVCRNREKAEMFQILTLLSGRSAAIKWRDMSMYEPKSQYLTNVPKMNGVWIVNIAKRDKVQIREKHISEETTTGVWCPILPSTYFVARRNDTVYVTGNTPIQGGAAVVVNGAAIRLVKRIKEEQLPMKLILQIHDQLIFEADEDQLLPLAKIIKEEMEHEVEINNRLVSFPVDVEAGKNLEDLKEIANL